MSTLSNGGLMGTTASPEAQQDLHVVELDVGDGEAHDPRQGLGVEQDQQRDQAVDQLDAAVIVDPADEGGRWCWSRAPRLSEERARGATCGSVGGG